MRLEDTFVETTACEMEKNLSHAIKHTDARLIKDEEQINEEEYFGVRVG